MRCVRLRLLVSVRLALGDASGGLAQAPDPGDGSMLLSGLVFEVVLSSLGGQRAHSVYFLGE
jgi:hypothetical protein